MMKAFGILCLFLLIETACFLFLGYSSKGNISSNPGLVPTGSNTMALTVKSRKLKENIDPAIPGQDDASHVYLQDYRPIDPVPSSKASIRPGPVQHGSPLMPYIPKPSPPPAKAKNGGNI